MTFIELVRKKTRDMDKAGYKTSQVKVKEALAQAYGYPNYNVCFYECGGRIPSSSFIEPTFWRVVGYPDGSIK